jgi:hypothetical protein
MAIPNEQAMEASRTGGVLSPASKNPNSSEYVEYANWLSAILKPKPGVLKSVIDAPIENSVTTGRRVPTDKETRLLPEGTSSDQVRDDLGNEILSPEGLQRFNDQNKVAVSPKQMLQTPQPDLLKMADDEFGVSQQIADTAKLAEADKARGLANEGDALDLLEMTEKKIINTDDGIDFNFEKMNSSEDVLEVINGVSEIIETGTAQFKRGKVSNVQTFEEARALLADETAFTKTILKQKMGTTLNATQMTALRMLLQSSAEKMSVLSKEILSGANSNENLLRFRRLMAIHAGLQMRAKGAQTEIARAMQAFSQPVGTRDPINKGNVIQELLDESGGASQALDLVKAFKKAEESGKKSSISELTLKGFGVKSQKVYQEIYINGMLANTKTVLKNTLATPAFIVYNQLTDLLGATTMSVIRGGKKVLGKEANPDGLFFEDIIARNYGMMTGFKDAWLSAYKTATTEIPAGRTNKIEGYNAIDSDFLGTSGTLGKAIDYMGKAIRIPGAGLQSTDDFWRLIVERGALYEQAVKAGRISRMNGADEVTANDNALMVLLDPESVAEELSVAGNRALLTENLTGIIGKGSKAIQNNFFGKLIVPFAKAPTNAIKMVAEGHPLTLIRAIFPGKLQDDLIGRNGGEVQQRTLTKFAVGSATMALTYELADNGRLTGAMPKDPKIRAMLPPNWQPYSMVFRGDDFPVDDNGDKLPYYDKYGNPNGKLVYVNYSGLEPVSAFIGIGADCAERRKRVVNQVDRENLLAACTAATTRYFKEVPFLQGMSSFFKSMDDDDWGVLARSPMSNMVGILPVPFSATLRLTNKAIDPQTYKSSVPINYYTEADANKIYNDSLLTDKPLDEIPYQLVGTVKDEGAMKEFWNASVLVWKDQMKSNPWWQKTEEEYQVRYDVLGNKLKTGVPASINPVQSWWNVLTPFAISYGEEMKPWQKELIKIGMPLQDEKKSMSGVELDNARRGQLNFIAKDPTNENAITLALLPGASPVNFQTYLSQHMTTFAYMEASRKDKIQQISDIEDDFYEAAFQQLLAKPENEDLYIAVEGRKKSYVRGAK